MIPGARGWAQEAEMSRVEASAVKNDQLLDQWRELEAAHARVSEALERSDWNHARAAESLGIGRTTLWRKLKEYGIEK